MTNDKLHFFRIAKQLNEEHHEILKRKQLHFRGNINSFSLVSVNQKSPERGKSGLKSKESAENVLKKLKLETPGRLTEEKNLQAFIIRHSINNNGILPFGDFTFVTSELAFQLGDTKRIVNDILALDSKNNLAIIELKSLRSNKVKQQTIDFEEKVVKFNAPFIKELVEIMTGKKWNGTIRKIAVWNAASPTSKVRENTFNDVELFNYSYVGEKTNEYIIMKKVAFSKE